MAESFGGEGGRDSGSSRESGRTWCLKRVGMSEEWLLLEDGGEVTIGRGAGVTYQLMSKSCPLMISRNHCVFKQNTEGQWTVTDNKSLNGVWLNCERIDPSRPYCLQEGDFIQLGVPLKHRETAEYEYTVIREEWKNVCPFLASRIDQLPDKTKDMRTKRKISLEESEVSGAEGPSNSRSKRDRVSFENDLFGKSEGVRTELSKQPTESTDIAPHPPKPSKKEKKKNHCSTAQPEPGLCVKSKDPKTSDLAQSWNGLEQIMKTLADMTKLKTKMQETQTAVLNVRQKNKKCAPKEIQVLEKELQDLQDQLHTKQEHQQQRVEQLEKTFCEELEGAKEEGEEKLKEQLAQVLMQPENDCASCYKAGTAKRKLAQLGNGCAGCLKASVTKRRPVWWGNGCAGCSEGKQVREAGSGEEEEEKEEGGKKEHHALVEELSRSKKDFEEIIKAKDRELKETKEEKEKARAQKEEALSQMNDVLENELQCTVCAELFIEAVTLNCAHSFCSYCINEWMKRRQECPICRGNIISKTRSLVLDNCIDRMVENLDDETKQHRLFLIQERKGQQAVPETPASESESSTFLSSSDSESSSNTSALDSETSSVTSMNSIMSISSYESDDYEEDSDNHHVILASCQQGPLKAPSLYAFQPSPAADVIRVRLAGRKAPPRTGAAGKRK
ncbi:hypothetical protein JD844_025039 [Phrynosoma platyrhinos]|uniref:E3 ubiquitin-protein ligase CHFR n=1 Tax=Phrynosoma platyrhinos TaxID=52577 RepID=A0ABQ7SZL4_PHRPL|nr:hypothetical protein JD844_025039 [Phrynosoma platyrhinos]